MSAATVAGAPVPVEVLADPAQAVDAWARWLRRTGLSDATKHKYEQQVRAWLSWLGRQSVHRPEDVLLDPHARDYVVRDYKRWMLTDGGSHPRAPKGVDIALTSLANLYEWVGLGRPEVRMAAGRATHAPKALDEDQTRAALRAAERRGTRDLAIVALLLNTGLRCGELVALNVDDVWISERKGELQVRAGKGDKPRKVPLNAQARDALRPWLAVRAEQVGPGQPALFVTREGRRMAERTMQHAVERVGNAAGLDMHPHLLRHTFATMLVRSNTDLVLVAELLGHTSLDTTRVYSRPTFEETASAVERVAVAF